MGNIAWIRTSKHVKNVPFKEAIEEVNRRRFGGHFTVEAHYDDLICPYFDFAIDGYPLWSWHTESSCKLGGKWPYIGDFVTWAWVTFRNEVGAAVGGRLGDEGVAGEWAPDPSLYPHMDDWFEERFKVVTRKPAPGSDTAAFLAKLWEVEKEAVPKKLRRYALRLDAMEILALEAE